MESITMLETRWGSPDGISVYQYLSGEEYPAAGAPLSEDLRDVFLREGWAVESDAFGAGEQKETKVEVVEETRAICGVMTARGTPCQHALPCRWHSK